MDIEIKNRINKLVNTDNNAALMIGCRTTEYFHECCEYNVLLVGEKDEARIINDEQLGFIQIEYIEREEFLRISNKEVSNLINSEIIQDNYFTLSTKIEDIKEHKSQIIKHYINSTDIELTTNIQKANNAINRSSLNDAAYWTSLSTYNLIKLSIAQDKIIPNPSHLLNQLKERKIEHNIDQYYSLLDLENATKSSVERRLQALNNLYRLLSTRIIGNQELFLRRMKLIENKIRWFIENKMITNAFVLLGYENLLVIEKIYTEYCNDKQVSKHNYRIISEITENNISSGIGKSSIKMLSITMDQQKIIDKIDIINNLLSEIRDNMTI